MEAEATENRAQLSRRTLFARLSVGLGAVIGGLLGVPVLGIFLSPLFRRREQQWRPVGAVSDFAIGATVKVTLVDPDPKPWAGFSAKTAVWLRRESERSFVALSAYCTHVGCPVSWSEGAQLFLCPCHGGAFHRSGTVAAGPPPRPLEVHDVRVRENQVEVRTRPIPSVT